MNIYIIYDTIVPDELLLINNNFIKYMEVQLLS